MRGERGAATVLTAACASVLLLVAWGAAWLIGVVSQHRTAQAAADLAALGGAQALAAGQSPCGAVDTISGANGARATECRVAGAEVWVVVEVEAPALFGRRPTVAGRAHAGPAPDPSPLTPPG